MSTEIRVIQLYVMVFCHCHAAAHEHTLLSSRSGSFSPLTFSQPLGPWHDAQTAHCADPEDSDMQLQPWRQVSLERFAASSPVHMLLYHYKDHVNVSEQPRTQPQVKCIYYSNHLIFVRNLYPAKQKIIDAQ